MKYTTFCINMQIFFDSSPLAFSTGLAEDGVLKTGSLISPLLSGAWRGTGPRPTVEDIILSRSAGACPPRTSNLNEKVFSRSGRSGHHEFPNEMNL